jgi:hypothetical protein
MFVPPELSSFSSSSCLMADHQTAAVVATLPTGLSRHIHGRYRGAIPRASLTDRDYIAGSDDKILGYTCVSSEYRNRPRPRMVYARGPRHMRSLTWMPSSFQLRRSPCRRKDRVILSSRPPHAHPTLYPPNLYQTCMLVRIIVGNPQRLALEDGRYRRPWDDSEAKIE